MENVVIERLNEFVRTLGLTNSLFEKTAKLSNGYLARTKNAPSREMLKRIEEGFPMLNMVWLETGTGNMIIGDISSARWHILDDYETSKMKEKQENADNPIKQRLIAFIKSKGIGQKRFEENCNLSNGYVNALKKSPSGDKIQSMLDAYPDLNIMWLITGMGTMLNTNNEVMPYIASNHSRIPLVSQYAQAGYLAGYADQEYMEQLPTVDFTPDREMSGNYVAFEVKGDSMDDGTVYSYLEGMIVICREVEPYLYKENKLHINKRDFVIVHTDGVLIKRITEHDVENHTITIHSLNPEYKDRVLDLADVKQIFSVVESRMQRRR